MSKVAGLILFNHLRNAPICQNVSELIAELTGRNYEKIGLT